MVVVAQLVEHLPVEQAVGGSIPLNHPKIMASFKFCPICGSKLQDKKNNGHPVPTCSNSSCNFKFYQSSKPTASAIITNDKGQILLSVRSIEPQKGKIDIIGGFLENGEDPIEGLKREVREELGVEIKVMKIIGIFIDKYMYDKRLDDIYTFNVFYEAKIISGKPKPADDISEVIWVDKNTVPWDKLAFKNTRLALKKYFEIK